MKKFSFIVLLTSVMMIGSCGKKEEPQTFVPPQQEGSIDKEKEQRDREEFERLKRLQSGDSTFATDTAATSDTSKMTTDTSKNATEKKVEKKKMVQKEKELNKRLDNPKSTITDYIEFLQRGTSEGGNFEQNMKRANDLWQAGNINRFKTNYKNTKKLVVLEEPKVVSQKGNEAVVEVRLKKVDNKNSKEEEMEMIVKYNLVADSKGKWKIKDNTVIKK